MMDKAPDRAERVYLTGFMGCGKSTIGPILANTIGYDFADVDRVVEQRTGRTITDIFRNDGERVFRTLEHQAIELLSARPHLVIALGGGTLTVPETFALVRSTGLLVYLSLAPSELMRRLMRRTDRPLLTDEGGERLPEQVLRQRIESLFAAREPLYRLADLTVPTDEQRVGLTVDRIVRRLTPHMR